MSISPVAGPGTHRPQAAATKPSALRDANDVPGVKDHDGDSDAAKGAPAARATGKTVGVNVKA